MTFFIQIIGCSKQTKLYVQGLRMPRHGSVIISIETKENVDILKKIELTNSGLKKDAHAKRKPRIVVISIRTYLLERELFLLVLTKLWTNRRAAGSHPMEQLILIIIEQ